MQQTINKSLAPCTTLESGLFAASCLVCDCAGMPHRAILFDRVILETSRASLRRTIRLCCALMLTVCNLFVACYVLHFVVQSVKVRPPSYHIIAPSMTLLSAPMPTTPSSAQAGKPLPLTLPPELLPPFNWNDDRHTSASQSAVRLESLPWGQMANTHGEGGRIGNGNGGSFMGETQRFEVAIAPSLDLLLLGPLVCSSQPAKSHHCGR